MAATDSFSKASSLALAASIGFNGADRTSDERRPEKTEDSNGKSDIKSTKLME
jgi:hypothetical protein